MIQNRIYSYFERNPQLHVLFIFDKMGIIQTELEDVKDWSNGYVYKVFNGTWFNTKYAIENTWKDKRVVLLFPVGTYPHSEEQQLQFPLLDMLKANMEYKEDDYASFMQQYNLPERFRSFIKKNIAEIMSSKIQNILNGHIDSTAFSEDLVCRAARPAVPGRGTARHERTGTAQHHPRPHIVGHESNILLLIREIHTERHAGSGIRLPAETIRRRRAARHPGTIHKTCRRCGHTCRTGKGTRMPEGTQLSDKYRDRIQKSEYGRHRHIRTQQHAQTVERLPQRRQRAQPEKRHIGGRHTELLTLFRTDKPIDDNQHSIPVEHSRQTVQAVPAFRHENRPAHLAGLPEETTGKA